MSTLQWCSRWMLGPRDWGWICFACIRLWGVLGRWRGPSVVWGFGTIFELFQWCSFIKLINLKFLQWFRLISWKMFINHWKFHCRRISGEVMILKEITLTGDPLQLSGAVHQWLRQVLLLNSFLQLLQLPRCHGIISLWGTITTL